MERTIHKKDLQEISLNSRTT